VHCCATDPQLTTTPRWVAEGVAAAVAEGAAEDGVAAAAVAEAMVRQRVTMQSRQSDHSGLMPCATRAATNLDAEHFVSARTEVGAAPRPVLADVQTTTAAAEEAASRTSTARA